MRILMGLLVLAVAMIVWLTVGAVLFVGLWILAVAILVGMAVYLLGTAALWALDRWDDWRARR